MWLSTRLSGQRGPLKDAAARPQPAAISRTSASKSSAYSDPWVFWLIGGIWEWELPIMAQKSLQIYIYIHIQAYAYIYIYTHIYLFFDLFIYAHTHRV